jgi:hypothetical protein
MNDLRTKNDTKKVNFFSQNSIEFYCGLWEKYFTRAGNGKKMSYLLYIHWEGFFAVKFLSQLRNPLFLEKEKYLHKGEKKNYSFH